MKTIREGIKAMMGGVGSLLYECGQGISTFAEMVKFYSAVNYEIDEDTYLQQKMTDREAAMKTTLVQIGEHENKLQSLGMKDYPEHFNFKDDLKRLTDLVQKRLKK